jgi:hypothetical protein
MSSPWDNIILRCFRRSEESSDGPSSHGQGLGTMATDSDNVEQEADSNTAAGDHRLTWKEKEATMRLKDHLRKLGGAES